MGTLQHHFSQQMASEEYQESTGKVVQQQDQDHYKLVQQHIQPAPSCHALQVPQEAYLLVPFQTQDQLQFLPYHRLFQSHLCHGDDVIDQNLSYLAHLIHPNHSRHLIGRYRDLLIINV